MAERNPLVAGALKWTSPIFSPYLLNNYDIIMSPFSPHRKEHFVASLKELVVCWKYGPLMLILGTTPNFQNTFHQSVSPIIITIKRGLSGKVTTSPMMMDWFKGQKQGIFTHRQTKYTCQYFIFQILNVWNLWWKASHIYTSFWC